jgi:hypothetical protein
MKTLLFTVYDSKAETYNKVLTFKTIGEAIRSFTEVANDIDTPFGKYPEDFTLFQIGEFDPHSGEIAPLLPQKTIGKAIDFKNQYEMFDDVQKSFDQAK